MDTAILPIISGYGRWTVNKRGDVSSQKHFVVAGKKFNTHLKLHRLIIKAPNNTLVDHINGDKLDNRISNLRITTKSINGLNSNKVRGEIPFRGVIFNKQRNKYQAMIMINYKSIHLGFYDKAEDASKAYEKFKSDYIAQVVEKAIIRKDDKL